MKEWVREDLERTRDKVVTGPMAPTTDNSTNADSKRISLAARLYILRSSVQSFDHLSLDQLPDTFWNVGFIFRLVVETRRLLAGRNKSGGAKSLRDELLHFSER